MQASLEGDRSLVRTTFPTSRPLEYFCEKELVARIGHDTEYWPLVALKELLDSALNAGEEAGIPPEIRVELEESGLTVSGNGSGLPAETVREFLAEFAGLTGRHQRSLVFGALIPESPERAGAFESWLRALRAEGWLD